MFPSWSCARHPCLWLNAMPLALLRRKHFAELQRAVLGYAACSNSVSRQYEVCTGLYAIAHTCSLSARAPWGRNNSRASLRHLGRAELRLLLSRRLAPHVLAGYVSIACAILRCSYRALTVVYTSTRLAPGQQAADGPALPRAYRH